MINGKNTHGIGVRNARSRRWSYQMIVARVPVQAIDGWNWWPGPEKLSAATIVQVPLPFSLPYITRANLTASAGGVRLLDALRENDPQ